jgi:hypothetical protein
METEIATSADQPASPQTQFKKQITSSGGRSREELFWKLFGSSG